MTNANEIIPRLREEHNLDLTDIRTKDDLKNALNQLRRPSVPKRAEGWDKLIESNELFEAEEVQSIAFENTKTDIQEAESRESVERIEVEEKIHQQRKMNLGRQKREKIKKIRDIARKTRIIHTTREGNSDIYFIRSWEEPVKKLLDFFNIKLKFDEDMFKNYIIKSYSAFTGKQAHLVDENQQELAKLNMQYYLEGKDFILNKLKNIESTETAILDILTKEKLKRFTNPFEITKKILEEQGLSSKSYSLRTSTVLSQSLELAYFCAWVGFYISILDGTDPGPEPWIIKLKESLSQPVH